MLCYIITNIKHFNALCEAIHWPLVLRAHKTRRLLTLNCAYRELRMRVLNYTAMIDLIVFYNPAKAISTFFRALDNKRNVIRY